jgi:hypothetical protein
MSIKRLIRVLVAGWIVSMVAGTVAAFRMKQRLGPNTEEHDDEIVASAIFGPLAYHSTAQRLRGGRLELWYGGGILDLRDAVLDPAGATLEVRAVFGGGQVLVPADWKVIASVRGLGGLTDVRPARGHLDGAPELAIEGIAIAGGFAVMSDLDEDGAEWLAEMETRQDVESSSNATPITHADAVEPTTETEMTPAG